MEKRVVAALCSGLLVIVLVLVSNGAAASSDAGSPDVAPSVDTSEPAAPDEPVALLLFHGEGCPHCAAERDFLDELVDSYPDLEIRTYEVWHDAANRQLFRETAAAYGFEASGVPTTFVGDRFWVGFNSSIGEEIEAVVAALLGGGPVADVTDGSSTVDVPLVGEVDVGDRSLVLATVLIGFVDGVNPCSLWVLSILLALVLHSGSRRRVFAVGSVFLLITSALYGLYIVGAYSALDYVGEASWIRAVVAAIAGVFGLFHLKEYVTTRGPSLTIPDARKPGLYQRMRALANPDRSMPTALGGTAVLAVGVSLLETPCTAGLPLLWADLLADRDVSAAGAMLLFLLYLGVFLLDELVVFAVAVVTLRAAKLQEHHGRTLQLVSGTLMVALAVTIVVAPELLESLVGTLAVFGGAAAVAAAVLVAERWLPRFPWHPHRHAAH